jgi:hypothetical protein
MKNIADIIRERGKKDHTPVIRVGKVRSRSGNSITVEPIDQKDVAVRVRLKVEMSKQNGWVVFPKTGTLIIYAAITPFDAILIAADEVDRILFTNFNSTMVRLGAVKLRIISV